MKLRTGVLLAALLLALAWAQGAWASAYSSAVLADSPVAYWRLDDTTCCTAADASGNGNTGTYYGTVSLGQPGATNDGGTSVSFGSSEARVARAPILTKLRDFTLEAWVYRTAEGKPLVVYNGDSGRNGYGILISDGGCWNDGDRLQILVGGNSCDATSSTATVPLDTWTYVAMTRTSDGTWTLYINGVANSTGTIEANAVDPNAGETSVGASWDGLNNHLDGRVDEVAVYDHALPADRILAHYQAAAGSGGDCTGDRCTQGVPPKTPLVFVPGILGSAIADPCGSPDKDPWTGALFDSSRLDHLAMNPDGTDKAGDCPKPDGVILSVFGQDVYGTMWNKLKDAGYVPDKTLFAFDYDWRRSADYNARLLVQYIQGIADETGKQVDILAHSQGGLVTMAALRMGGSVGFVRRVITMGTPAEGAAKAFDVLEYHSPCVVSQVSLWLFHFCPVNMGTVQKDVENMPGFYELLPAPYYNAAVGTSPLIQTNGLGLIYPDWVDFVAQDHNRALLDETTNFHYDVIDRFTPLDPTVRMERFIGNHHSTIVAIRLERQCYFVARLGQKICTSYRRTITSTLGDGTVPLNSADLQNTHNAFDERNGIPNVYFDADHLGLTRTAIGAAISYFSRPAVAMFSVRRSSDDDAGAADPGTPTTSLHVEITGDATGWVGDMGGASIGESAPDGPTIAGASDDSTDTTPAFSLDAAGAYTFHATSNGDAPLRVTIQRVADSVQQQSVFYLPSAQPGEQLTLPFGSDQDLAQVQLQVDENGDGVVDETLAPTATLAGDVPQDVTPPTTIAGANLSGPGTTTVTLLATDDPGGVGVAATYYVLDGADTPTQYTGPFQVPLYSTLHYWSVDKVGNVEDAQTIVADDASNYRALAATIQPGDMLDRTIWPVGDEDWFAFTADGTSTYRAQIVGLTHDYDLELTDANGNVLQAPYTRSSASEQVRAVLPAGTYYLHVVGYGGAADQDHPYKLKLQTLGR